jgi:hypothetical protein
MTEVNWRNTNRRLFRSYGEINKNGDFVYNGNWQAIDDHDPIRYAEYHFEGEDGREETIPAGKFKFEGENEDKRVELLHGRYRHYDGNLPKGLSSVAYDTNNLGIEVMIILDEMIERGENNCLGTSLEGVIVRHHKRAKGNDYHNVFVAATAEQWQAVKKYWESAEASDWGNCWDDCPEVLKNWD